MYFKRISHNQRWRNNLQVQFKYFNVKQLCLNVMTLKCKKIVIPKILPQRSYINSTKSNISGTKCETRFCIYSVYFRRIFHCSTLR